MNLRFFHGIIDNNYGWELELFRKNRELKDGFTTIDLKINFDQYVADHNPRFEFSLTLFNFNIFDFSIYNVWHLEHEQSPFYGLSDAEVETLDASYHSRKNFYHGKDIYWYRLFCDGHPISASTEQFVPQGFLRVTDSEYFEFGGELYDAKVALKLGGFRIVMEGDEI
jgi:hypothetical protein